MSNKIKVFFCSILAFLLLPIAVWAAPASSLYFEPKTIQSSVNKNFSLKLKINPGTNRVSAIELYLEFDANRLRLNSITPSSAFGIVLQPANIDNNQGKASVVLGAPPTAPVSSISDLVNLSFTTKTAGQTNISIPQQTEVVAINETGNVIVSYGQPALITISGSSLPVTPTPAVSFTPWPSLRPSSNPSFSPVVSVLPKPSPKSEETETGLFPNLKRYVQSYQKRETTEPEKDRSALPIFEFIKGIFSALGNFFKNLFK
ncbi:MAG: cohesin domain-containing protein [Patescibacteria group bacterium]